MDQETEFVPEKQIIIEDLETLKLLSDALKQQILMAVYEKAKTVKQIAKELGTTPTKLYYHIAPLEERGLVKVVSTRVVSGILEKQYRAAAEGLVVKRALLSLSGSTPDEELDEALQNNSLSVFDYSRREIEASFRAGLLMKHLTQGRLNLTLTQAETLGQELAALLNRYDQPLSNEPDAAKYGLLLALYPLAPDEVAADVLG